MKFPRLFCVGLVAVRLAAAPAPSPYAGESTRTIKALSEAEISGLTAGRGLGLARAAELNSYPGPMHVLDLADELQLTPAQRADLDRVVEAMRSAAIALGRQVIDREAELDRLFAGRTATPESVAAATAAIGELQGRLRATHLNAHVATARVLTAAQITQYNRLRGYPAADRSAASHD